MRYLQVGKIVYYTYLFQAGFTGVVTSVDCTLPVNPQTTLPQYYAGSGVQNTGGFYGVLVGAGNLRIFAPINNAYIYCAGIYETA